MKRIKQGLLDMMNITEEEYEGLMKIKRDKQYQEIKVNDLLYKPNSDFVKTDILGISFMGINKSPNVYVLKTDDVIKSEFIKFTYENLTYTLNNVYLHSKDGYIYLECNDWKEEVIN